MVSTLDSCIIKVFTLMSERKRGRQLSIMDFLSGKGRSSDSNVKSDVLEGVEGKTTGDKEVKPSSFIDEVLRNLIQSRSIQTVKEPSVEKQVDTLESKPVVPERDVLDRILYEGLHDGEVICHSNGTCSDGHNVSDIYVDKYGFRRQRGFVTTTRLPVYLDWIVEEAIVEEIMPRTFVVKTNRGTLAVIPEDFLCELHTRYGIIIKNYDKCKNYKPSVSRDTSRRRKK